MDLDDLDERFKKVEADKTKARARAKKAARAEAAAKRADRPSGESINLNKLPTAEEYDKTLQNIELQVEQERREQMAREDKQSKEIQAYVQERKRAKKERTLARKTLKKAREALERKRGRLRL